MEQAWRERARSNSGCSTYEGIGGGGPVKSQTHGGTRRGSHCPGSWHSGVRGSQSQTHHPLLPAQVRQQLCGQGVCGRQGPRPDTHKSINTGRASVGVSMVGTALAACTAPLTHTRRDIPSGPACNPHVIHLVAPCAHPRTRSQTHLHRPTPHTLPTHPPAHPHAHTRSPKRTHLPTHGTPG